MTTNKTMTGIVTDQSKLDNYNRKCHTQAHTRIKSRLDDNDDKLVKLYNLNKANSNQIKLLREYVESTQRKLAIVEFALLFIAIWLLIWIIGIAWG